MKNRITKRAITSVLTGALAFGCIGAVSANDDDDRSIPATVLPAISQKVLDISYANTSDAQKLDLYLPRDAGDNGYPVIVAIHEDGDKSTEIDSLTEALNRGYAVAVVNYKQDDKDAKAAIQDVKASIVYLRANGWYYNLDTNHIAAWGGSLAALAGTSGDVAELKSPSISYGAVSDRVEAVVNLKATASVLDPAAYVTADDAAFFIPSSPLAEKLTQVLEHNDVTIAASDDEAENVSKALNFLDAHMK